MSKLKIFFILSLVLLGVLLGFTVVKPMTTLDKFSAIASESIIKKEHEWIIVISIINKEDEPVIYSIAWSSGGEVYNSKHVLIKSGRTFTDMHYVYPETAKDGKINLTIHKGDDPTPVEQSTYYVKFD